MIEEHRQLKDQIVADVMREIDERRHIDRQITASVIGAVCWALGLMWAWPWICPWVVIAAPVVWPWLFMAAMALVLGVTVYFGVSDWRRARKAKKV